MSGWKKSNFCRFIAKVMVFLMIIQGWPLLHLSKAYHWQFQPEKIQRVLHVIFSTLPFQNEAHAATPPNPDDYVINRIPGNFVDISNTGTPLTLSDDGGISGIPVGFDFEFFGTSFNSITITANGYLSFSNLSHPDNKPIPTSDSPNSLIAPFWDDLDPELNAQSGIYFETLGTAPSRQFVVQWKDVPLKMDPTSRLTFEVILFEGIQEIQFQYVSMIDGGGGTGSGPVSGDSATIGIENDDGTRGNQVSFKKNGAVASGSAFSFTLGGSAFQTGRMLGDLDEDGTVTILDQSILTEVVVEQAQPLSSLELLLSDVSPCPGAGGRSFGDGVIDTEDHTLLFEVIMGRESLNPSLSAGSYYAASPGDALTLYGSGFDPLAENNTVVFIDIDGNETTAIADSVNGDGTELTVIVPAGLRFITSIRIERSAQPSNPLLFVLEDVPTITGITPGRGGEGDVVFIRGHEFSTNPAENLVSFNGVSATVGSVLADGASDVLSVTVPNGATSGPVTVTVGGETSNEMAFSVREPLQAVITTPQTDTEVTAPVEIIGTAWDEELDYYVLEYASAGTSDFTEFSRGTTAVEDGVLGTFDPTLLENGIYTVRLTVFNEIGQFKSSEVSYFVTGDFKVGLFTVSFKDLEIPLAGIPIQVIRTYDSRHRATEGDFGYGWTLSVRSYPKIQKNRAEGESWTQNMQGGSGYPYYYLEGLESHAVVVTLENGRTLEFDFTPTPSYQAIYPLEYTKAAYTPRPGTAASLEPIGDKDLVVCGDGLCTYDMWLYDPQDFKLTLEDGTVYEISLTEGLSAVEDGNGNEITFTDDGIFHSCGESIGFTRDAEGQITTVTDPAGNEIIYTYDANGDLASIKDRNDNTTTFTYLVDHYLDEIRDPLGNPVSKNEYDASGRLVAMIDAEGNRIEYSHDMDARQEVVEDRLGYITIYEYDDKGNVVGKTDHLGRRWIYTYNGLGYKTSESDPLGNTTTFTHDDKGHVLTMTDPLDNTTTYTYDAQGHMLTETDPLNHITENVYDTDGNLVSVTDPAGGTVTYTYNGRGLKTSETVSPDGVVQYVTTYEYDTRGHLIKETDPLDHETLFEYDSLGRKTRVTKTRTTETDPVSVTTEFTYDGEDNVLTEKDGNGAVKTYEYDSLGNKTAEIDPLDRRTEFEYDDRGNLIKTVYPDGRTQMSSFDFEGRLVSRTDRAGKLTQYDYDFADHLVKTIYPDNTFTENTYDEVGRLVKTTNPNGAKTEYGYDGAGRLTILTDPLQNQVFYEYDAADRRIKMTDSLGRETQYQYDAMGRLIRTVFPDGTTQQTTYDLLGRKTSEIDQAGKTTQYEYDALGRVVGVIDALGHRTSYTFDELGNKTSQTDPNNHITRWTYDNVGHELSRTLPMGMSEHFTYDLAGNLESKVDLNGSTTEYTYDQLNRLVSKNFADNSSVAYTYTFMGDQASITDGNGTVSYVYDSRRRLIEVVNPDGSVLTYTYDAAGNRLSATVHSGIVETSRLVYEYDALNRLTSVTDADDRVTSYEYDKVGNRTKMTYPNGVEARYTYDDLNRLIDLKNVAQDNSTISSYAYTLGASGNRVHVVEDNGRTVDYAYDDVYRLTQETITNDPAGVNTAISYTYDNFGNRLTKTDSAGVISYTYDANDRLTVEAGPGFTRTYVYDANGNRIGEDDGSASKTYVYDYENRMTGVQTATSQSTYTYDADGLRIGEDVDGAFKRYIFDKNRKVAQVLEERENNGTVIARYAWGNTLDPIFMERSGSISHYLADGNLNIRILVDSAAAITDMYDLDAFGNVLTKTGSTENCYFLHGQYFDANAGFYYLRARWMDPNTGTFMSLDPAVGSPFEPQSLHKYVFAANNPLTLYDPLGLFSLAELNVTVGVVQILSMISLPIFFGMMTGVFIKYILGPGFRLRNTAIDILDVSPKFMLAGQRFGTDPISQAIKILTLGNDIIRIGALSIELADSLTKAFGAFQALTGALKSGLSVAGVAGGAGGLSDLKGALGDMDGIAKRMDPIAKRLAKEIRSDVEEKPIKKKNRVEKAAAPFDVTSLQWQKVSETFVGIASALPW